MEAPFYTLATWRVRPGEEERFIAAWKDMGAAFAAVPDSPPVEGTLLRRLDDPSVFVSFGGWPTRDAIARMRADPHASAAMKQVMQLCTDADPAAYEHVTTARPAMPSV